MCSFMSYSFTVPVHSCEPSLDCHIKIIEVLVTSEMSENQAAPGMSLLHFKLFFLPSKTPYGVGVQRGRQETT